MSKQKLLAGVVALGLAATGAIAQTTTPPATTTTPPERMNGSSTANNPATATTPAPGTSAATPTPDAAPTTPGTTRSDAGTPGNTAVNNAINTSPENKPGAPVSGANSFTEGQARSRMEDRGFSQVSDLKLDAGGIWRAKATKDGKSVEVALDYQGNVVAQ